MKFSLLIAGVAVAAAINISFGSATSINIFQRCIDIPTASIGSTFNISCLTGQRIIVDSALIGATFGYSPPADCSITDKTCTRNVSFVAENCTGYSSCEIAPRLLLHDDESEFSCVVSNFKLLGANFVSINYFCITPRAEFYGDISRFEADIFTNDSVPVYISSYPNFPDGIQSTVPFRCSCSFTPKPQPISLTGWIIIRTVLVKLSGIDPNSEVLSIRFGNETRLNFNSPSTTVNNITYIPINSAFTITYERRSYVAAATSKFLLELTVGSSPGSGTAGHIKCNASSLNDSFDFSSRPTFSSTMIADSSPWNQKSESQGQVLTPGAIAGVVIGSVAFLALIVIVSVLLIIIRKRKQRKQKHGMVINVNQTFNIVNGVPINQFDLSENPVPSTASTKLAQTDNQQNEKVLSNSSAYDNVVPVGISPSSLAKVGTPTEIRPKAELMVRGANTVEDTRKTVPVGYGERAVGVGKKSVENEGEEEEDKADHRMKGQQPKAANRSPPSRNIRPTNVSFRPTHESSKDSLS